MDSEKMDRAEAFWQDMERCLARLGEYREYPFASAMKLLKEGAEAKIPELMFLWAEFLFWGRITSDNSVWTVSGEGLLDEPEDPDEEIEIARSTYLSYTYGRHRDTWLRMFADVDEDDELWYRPGPFRWYRAAAEAGYVPAMCWLAWCAMRGLGMERDEEKSCYWIEQAGKYPKIGDLIHPRLSVFTDAAYNLGEEARDMDLQEDIDADSYCSCGYYPWRELFAASVMAYQVGCSFGSPECALPEYMAYDYADGDSRARRRMYGEKRMWQIWCGIHGIGLEQVSAQTLREWRVDIDNAWGKRELEEETQELLHELTGAVLRK